MPKKNGVRIHRDIASEVAWLQKIPKVSRVIIGSFHHCKKHNKPGSLQWLKDLPTGCQLRAFTSEGAQDLYLVFNQAEKMRIQQLVQRRHPSTR